MQGHMFRSKWAKMQEQEAKAECISAWAERDGKARPAPNEGTSQRFMPLITTHGLRTKIERGIRRVLFSKCFRNLGFLCQECQTLFWSKGAWESGSPDPTKSCFVLTKPVILGPSTKTWIILPQLNSAFYPSCSCLKQLWSPEKLNSLCCLPLMKVWWVMTPLAKENGPTWHLNPCCFWFILRPRSDVNGGHIVAVSSGEDQSTDWESHCP